MSQRSAFTSPVRRALAGVVVIYVVFFMLCAGRFVCLRALLYPGMVTGVCPSGDILPGADVAGWSLQRGAEGAVVVTPVGWFTDGQADAKWREPVWWGRVTLSLVAPDGSETPLEPEDGWDRDGADRTAGIVLPDVVDGDYILRANVRTMLGEVTQDTPLPLYAPARAHLLTDRPLYEAGHTVQFRALTLRSADRAPLEGRPGVFQVHDPDGLLVFEERATTDAWGVAASDLPLDASATSGAWRLTWRTGDLVEEGSFDVRPFTLPRFTVSGTGNARWFEPGDVPTVEGRVVFASGAPVADAVLQMRWRVDGAWPMPTSWAQGALPLRTVTDADGVFTLELPDIPADLRGQATLVGRIEATSPAGDTESGAVQLLLSEYGLLADAVTELEGGLVQGFNNRVYLRLTTPDGAPVRDTTLKVSRAWDPRDPGIDARTDVDGVAALQLDPGPPVNVMVPAQPVRPPIQPDPVSRRGAWDLSRSGPTSMADLLVLDRLLADVQPCARFVTSGTEAVSLGLSVRGDGLVSEAFAGRDGLSLCLAAAHRGLRIARGVDRVVRVEYAVQSPDRPSLTPAVDGAPVAPAGLQRALQAAAADARRCLPQSTPSGEMADLMAWTSRRGSAVVATRWVPGGSGGVMSGSVRGCVRAALSTVRLSDAAKADAVGIARLRTTAAPSRAVAQPQPTTMLGYELTIAASVGGADPDKAVLRLHPGEVPPVRLRADPVLASGGDVVTVDVLRGPDLDQELPEDLYLRTPNGDVIEAKLDPKSRTAKFTLPADLDGWFEVALWDAVARIYVAPTVELDVTVAAADGSYAPGDTATLTVTTTSGDQPVPAGVSLVGVDATLAQLVSLPGPGALDGLQPEVGTDAPAFGALDGQALAMGRIRGANAAAATVLRVSQVPSSSLLETPVNVQSTPTFDPVIVLTDRFYTVLGALHKRVRRWEKEAAAGEQMTPATMARFWSEARDAVAADGGQPTDAYGRPLRLSALPADLLDLTDPRQVVVDGTRLPEDVERWDRYVAEEDPR